LMQIYEKTIGELRMEIARLQEKIDIYERTVMDLRDHIAQLEAKIDIMKARMAGTNAVPAPLTAPRE
jgi:phage shock protein A